MKNYRYNRGVSAIEFALILPVMATAFYVLVSYSINFLYLISLNSMAAESARGAISIYSSTQVDRDSQLRQSIDELVSNSLIKGVRGCDGDEKFTVKEIDDVSWLNVCLGAESPLPPLWPFSFDGPLQASASVRINAVQR